MRMIMYLTLPVDAFNLAVKDGSIGTKMTKILDEQKPEAAYFTDRGGHRSAVIVFDMANASQIPAYAEPWFLTFNAQVEIHPVMIGADLRAAGLEGLGKKWG